MWMWKFYFDRILFCSVSVVSVAYVMVSNIGRSCASLDAISDCRLFIQSTGGWRFKKCWPGNVRISVS